MLTSRFETLKMNENHTFSSFYFELSDIVNSSFNLGEPIPDSKVIRKILRSLPERFRPKVTAIEESKDIDSLRVDELVGSIQTYEMTLPNSHKSKKAAFKASEIEDRESEEPNGVTREELAHMAKRIKKAMRFPRKSNKGPDFNKGKRFSNSTREKGKGNEKC